MTFLKTAQNNSKHKAIYSNRTFDKLVNVYAAVKKQRKGIYIKKLIALKHCIMLAEKNYTCNDNETVERKTLLSKLTNKSHNFEGDHLKTIRSQTSLDIKCINSALYVTPENHMKCQISIKLVDEKSNILPCHFK